MKVHQTAGILAVALLTLVTAGAPAASAHSTYPLGDEYGGTIGWLNEPPIVDEPNAVLIRLKGPADAPGAVVAETDGHAEGASSGGHGDAAAMVPISGQAQNLSVVLKIAGKETTLSFRESRSAPGEYLANVIQTVPGVYNATYSFTVNGQTYNIVRDLQEVQPAATQAFPEQTKSHFELQREIDQMKEDIAALKAEAQTQSETPATLTSQPPTDDDAGGNGVPMPAVGLVVLGVALVAFAVGRRR